MDSICVLSSSRRVASSSELGSSVIASVETASALIELVLVRNSTETDWIDVFECLH